MDTSTETRTDNSKRPALPTALEMMDYYRRNGRQVVGYRAFSSGIAGTNWVQECDFIPCERTALLNMYESEGLLLSPVYADEVK